MKWIKRKPEHVGYLIVHDEKLPEYRCPNENCGLSVAEGYVCCPYCGQKLGTFEEDEQAKVKYLRMKTQKVSYK